MLHVGTILKGTETSNIVITGAPVDARNMSMFTGSGMKQAKLEYPVIHINLAGQPVRDDELLDIELADCEKIGQLTAEQLACLVAAHDIKEATAQKEFEEKSRIRSEKVAAFKKQIPAWAKAAIVAEFHVSECDPYSDYFGSRIEKSLVIGWCQTDKNSLRECRKFAEQCDILKGIPWEEHRETWSMGAGYYLAKEGASRYSGWRILKKPTKYMLHEFHDIRLPLSQRSQEPQKITKVTIRPGKREGYSEIVFPEKPDAVVLSELKESGFRWHHTTGVWWGKTDKVPACLRDALAA